MMPVALFWGFYTHVVVEKFTWESKNRARGVCFRPLSLYADKPQATHPPRYRKYVIIFNFRLKKENISETGIFF